MHAPYRELHSKPHIHDLPENPPELTDAKWDRNNRNSMRQDAIDALDMAISRLDELDHDGIHRHTQKRLEDLQEYLQNDMED
jgi:hypothetical protein